MLDSLCFLNIFSLASCKIKYKQSLNDLSDREDPTRETFLVLLLRRNIQFESQ